MTDVNKGEIGEPLRINLGVDISLAREAIIVAQPEVGETKEFVATIPAVPVTVNNVTLNANEYAEYTTLTKDDLDYEGRWRMRLKADFSSTSVRKTNYVKFRVLA